MVHRVLALGIPGRGRGSAALTASRATRAGIGQVSYVCVGSSGQSKPWGVARLSGIVAVSRACRSRQVSPISDDGALLSESPEKFIVRAIGIDTANSYRIVLPTIVDVLATLRLATYDTKPWSIDSNSSFRNTLEGFVIDSATHKADPDQQAMHNIVHDWVGGIFYLPTATGQLVKRQGTMEPLDVSPNDPVFFLHHANVDRIWASWQAAHPGAAGYEPPGGESVCPFPHQDDPGPDVPFPHISDRAHGHERRPRP